MSSILKRYLDSCTQDHLSQAAVAFYASLDQVISVVPDVARAIVSELRDQRKYLKLIASENYCSLAVQQAHANLLTDKYAEGVVGKRFYAGCHHVDTVESVASQLACQLFGAEHAYVQPHSGADANLVAFMAILNAKIQTPLLEKMGEPNPMNLNQSQWNEVRTAFQKQKLLGLDYYSGGHLTHGYRFNISGYLFDSYSYSVDPETHLLNLDALRKQAHEIKPTILIGGYSAYSRKVNFAKMREIAEEVGAILMVDMAHFAGLVAGKAFSGDYDPVAHAHIVTTTTHKTLRGPRGGLVLCKKEFAELVDKGCPAVLGGPLSHVMAAKAVAFQEALTPEFQTYAANIIKNASALAEELMSLNVPVLTGGTENHLLLADVSQAFGLTGRQAETALRESGLTMNRNALPNDPNGPWYTSGIRVGTSAATTRGMKEDDMKTIARVITNSLAAVKPEKISKGKNAGNLSKNQYHFEPKAQQEQQAIIHHLLDQYPLYPELDLDLIESCLG